MDTSYYSCDIINLWANQPINSVIEFDNSSLFGELNWICEDINDDRLLNSIYVTANNEINQTLDDLTMSSIDNLAIPKVITQKDATWFKESLMVQKKVTQDINISSLDDIFTESSTKKKGSEKSLSSKNCCNLANRPMRISLATEEQEMDKKKKFLERNRQIAMKFRERKKVWLKNLQINIETLTADNVKLKNENSILQQEIKLLKTQLLIYEGSFGKII